MTDEQLQELHHTLPEQTIAEAATSTLRNKRNGLQSNAMGADLLKAHVALLEKEILLSKHGDIFRLVQHHYRRLQAWHDQYTGWRIQRTSTLIRLVRHSSTATQGYQYERLRDAKDFACLTWILWYAENRQLSGRGNDQQFLLSQLADQIQEQSSQGEEEGTTLDFRRQTDRYSIQRALHYLGDLGGLQLVDGQTREWVDQTGNVDVLYEFTDVARSLVAALDAGAVAESAAQLHPLQPGLLPMAQSVPALMRAWRSLLLGPALFAFDDSEAFAVLRTHAETVATELLDTFGWLLEIQRNYACIIRPLGSATGPTTTLTIYGTLDQIVLLLCAALRERLHTAPWATPDQYGCLHLTNEDMNELFFAVRERFGDNWGNDARSRGSSSLLNDVSRKMRQLGMLRGPDENGNILILPLAARFSASYEKPEQQTPTTGRTRSRARAKTARPTPALPGME
ncbi:MAG TPA: TIGR02678 family protein [Ktedonobacteraceae bacterium]|jgi:uncharacterized protein (TIGR02678 family)|nr:TIGR02678 family protein [Ktedonobacteraceae bacterium]